MVALYYHCAPVSECDEADSGGVETDVEALDDAGEEANDVLPVVLSR